MSEYAEPRLPAYDELPRAAHGGRSAWGLFGMALGELWWLEDLALSCRRDGRYEMFLTAAPINVPGGVGSPANALAIK